ncbi:MAG: glutamine--tRNA ligase/YqeY domain fusion protein [Myxococcota bacterium]
MTDGILQADEPGHFITEIIDADLASGRHSTVVTRFPPEPNGYLHIGHAKSICLNFGLALRYGGRCHLRMDDTNPAKEDVEYVESIKEDVRWLGFEWGDHMYHASDNFEGLYALAVKLIKDGKAYVCELDDEEIRTYRGSLTEAGQPSPYRDRSVEDNLRCFAAMRAGEYPDGAVTLRAKIDMAAANMKMRDPLMYRVRHTPHDRTGDTWCIYPMYDYAHGLSDAFEGITHSICTLEFENNRELYDWFVQASGLESQPRQYEFARLSLGYTLMSKRKLRKLVEEGYVQGWDDPRMPTIAGLRRRGVRASAIRRFAAMIGISKANSRVDRDKLDFCVRDDLNHDAPRVMAVLEPLKLTIRNYPDGQTEHFDAPYYPHDVPKDGTRPLPFSKSLFIDRSDFREEPPKGYFRLSPGREVRLRYAYLVTCEEVIKDADGHVVEVICRYDEESQGGQSPDGRKVKGTIQWVDAGTALPFEARVYDRLFSCEDPEDTPEGDDFTVNLNPGSDRRYPDALIENSIANDDAETRYQFERLGYYWRDPVDTTEDTLVFNRIVTLRDSWAKKTKRPNAPAPEPKAAPKSSNSATDRPRPTKRSKSELRAKARAEDATLQAAFERFQKQIGLSADDADVLTGESGLASLYERAAEVHGDAQAVAKWVRNELIGALKGRLVEDLPLDGDAIAALVSLIDDGTISGRASKTILDAMIETGKDPKALVTELGLEQITDTGAIEATIAEIIAANPEKVAAYRDGRTKLLGFFIGQAMKETGGRADPKAVQALVRSALS